MISHARRSSWGRLDLGTRASEAEIAAALVRLAKEPQFGIAARRLRDAMTIEIKSERLVSELEEIVRASGQEPER